MPLVGVLLFTKVPVLFSTTTVVAWPYSLFVPFSPFFYSPLSSFISIIFFSLLSLFLYFVFFLVFFFSFSLSGFLFFFISFFFLALNGSLFYFSIFFFQGLAFATVAGIPLLYGLYIVWAPPFFYSLYGVSLHVSYGPFALVGLFMNDALGKRGYKPCDGLCRNESEQTEVKVEV